MRSLTLEDPTFVKLAQRMKPPVSYVKGMIPFWSAFSINSAFEDSTRMGMHVHFDDSLIPLVEYKLLRGARFESKFKKSAALQDSLSAIIPGFFTQSIPDFIDVRNSKELRAFRKEFGKIDFFKKSRIIAGLYQERILSTVGRVCQT